MIVNTTKATIKELRDTLECGSQPLSLYCRYYSTEHSWLTSLDCTISIIFEEHMREAFWWFDSPEYWGQDILIAPEGASDEWVEEWGVPVASVRKPNH